MQYPQPWPGVTPPAPSSAARAHSPAQAVQIYHDMIADHTRMAAYQAALRRHVTPQTVVADLGCGAGVLGYMALMLGAKHLYAIDASVGSLALAREIAADNGLTDRVTFLEGDVREVVPDRPIDLVVTETMGNIGNDEGLGQICHGFARHLEPGGRFLPRRVTGYLAPVELQAEHVGAWRHDWFGLDLRAGGRYVAGSEMPTFTKIWHAPTLLAEPAVVDAVEVGAPDPWQDVMDLRFPITRAGRLHGFLGWFEAELDDGITLSNLPTPPMGSWGVWLQPTVPTELIEGQEITATLDRSRGLNAISWTLSWRLRPLGAG